MIDQTWYVARCHDERTAFLNLYNQLYSPWSPWFVATVTRHGRKVRERRYLFSSYLFVAVDENSPSVVSINNTVGVVGLVTAAAKPLRVPNKLMDALIGQCRHDGMITTDPVEFNADVPQVGEIRRIIGGVFLGQMAEIAGQIDRKGDIAVLIGSLRASLPARDVGGVEPAPVR